MKILYLDCFSGISGDMMLGALLDLGLPLEVLDAELRKMNVEGYCLSARKRLDGAIQGTDFSVEIPEPPPGHAHDVSSALAHPHHAHSATAHSHDAHHQPANVHRRFADIKALLSSSTLEPKVREMALAIFQRLAEAEGKIHGLPPEQVAFHEVGAVDSLVDIVGAAVGLCHLEVDEIVASALPLGQGEVRCQHGVLPLPAPATLELLRGIPVYDSGLRHELVTPTGAAVVSTLCSNFGGWPSFQITAVGYGLGKRRGGESPNALRAVLGESSSTPASLNGSDTRATVIETNIDDMNPQFYAPLMDRLLEAGALDVSLEAIVMKKGRPGTLLRILTDERRREGMLEILFLETTSLGARFYPVERACLERKTFTADTPLGPIRIKAAYRNGQRLNMMPEFEDCLAISKQEGYSLKQVHQEALHRAISMTADDKKEKR